MFERNSSMHAYMTSAKKRIDEMDRSLAGLERMARDAKARRQTAKLVSELKTRRDRFAATIKEMKMQAAEAETRIQKLSKAAATSWSAFGVAAARSRKAFQGAGNRSGKAIRRGVK